MYYAFCLFLLLIILMWLWHGFKCEANEFEHDDMYTSVAIVTWNVRHMDIGDT